MKFVAESEQSATGQIYFKTTYASDMKVKVSDIKGEVVRRTLPVQEFKEILGMSEKPVKSWVHIPKGFIPGSETSDYIDGWVMEDGWSMVWRVKGKVRLMVHSSGHYHIPFPDILFTLRMENGMSHDMHAYVIDDKDILYQYPFGNVGLQGHICMGSISFKGIKSPMDFTDEFFLGKTNNDYFHPGDHVKPKYEQAELLRKLDGKDKFPKRWLIKLPYGLKDVLDHADPTKRSRDW